MVSHPPYGVSGLGGLLFLANDRELFAEVPKKIGMIRVLRKDMDMWHVNFKEY